jgi:hypothetical protein
MSIYTSTSIKKQVGKLFQLYESGQVNETTARNLNKILELEVNQLQIDLAATEKDLGEFERQYNMSTTDFASGRQAKLTTAWIMSSGHRWRKWREICGSVSNFSPARTRNDHR